MQGSGPVQDCDAVQQRSTGPAWWLVDVTDRVLAGPFVDHGEAIWATGPLAEHSSGPARTGGLAYGVRRPDDRISRRPSPEDRAWLADLSAELERVAEEWDPLVDDTAPLVGLLCQLGAGLVEAGLPLHDCAGRSDTASRGGVCLTPTPTEDGVVVTWAQHVRTTRDAPRPADVEHWVQDTMNRALTALLTGLGFSVTPFGQAGVALVTGRRGAPPQR